MTIFKARSSIIIIMTSEPHEALWTKYSTTFINVRVEFLLKL